MTHAPFLILETGTPLAPLQRHGGFAHWIRVAAGLSRHEARVCAVAQGDALPDATDFAGVFITGSAAMVTERLPWSEATAMWLRDAVQREVPAFGICYGHQLLAHALGGHVTDNPSGREMGTVPLQVSAQAARDPIFAALPAQAPAHTTHLQTVLQPPMGAQLLARSERDGCQALRMGEHAWGVQFHPEFSTAMMRGYIHERTDALHREGTDPRALHRAVRPTPAARRLLPRFVRHARNAAG